MQSVVSEGNSKPSKHNRASKHVRLVRISNGNSLEL